MLMDAVPLAAVVLFSSPGVLRLGLEGVPNLSHLSFLPLEGQKRKMGKEFFFLPFPGVKRLG
jgi:hypothetical protein